MNDSLSLAESICLVGALLCEIVLTVICAIRFANTGDMVCIAYTIVFAFASVVLGLAIYRRW